MIVRPTYEKILDFPLATKLCLREEIERHGWKVGDYSYGAPLVFDLGFLTIGRFCSIAVGVSVMLGNHRMDRVSTYPFKLLNDFCPGTPDIPEDHETRGGVEIGSDVWLGAHSVILSGVRIGSGAVVGAGSIVTKDVPPYAVVAGNPARLLRYRCTEPQIAALLALAWWDWPDEKIRTELPLLSSLSVDEFIARYG